jgi:hypothetical protein
MGEQGRSTSEKTNLLKGKQKKKLWLNFYDYTKFNNWMSISTSKMELV